MKSQNLLDILSDLNPVLSSTDYVYIHYPNNSIPDEAIAFFREVEGLSLIVEKQWADARAIPYQLTLSHICINIQTSLELVGLTASLSTALTEANIPCNMVAAFHHDHIFIPSALKDRALQCILNLTKENP